MMRLRILLPTGVLIDEPAAKIVAEAENGFFGLLPRHVDFVTALVPGILVYLDEGGCEKLVAVDEGVLVKCGAEVSVSTRNAACGVAAADLQRTVRSQFTHLSEEEEGARSALARLEAGALRRFLEFEEHALGR